MDYQDDTGFPQLPVGNPQNLQETIFQAQVQRELLAQLRAQALQSDDGRLLGQADALEAQYHARDLAALADDSYLSAAGQPMRQFGYLRGSENTQLLTNLTGWDEKEIRKLLQPSDSSFRAEIYLPNPEVYGTDRKPVVVYKGTSGLVQVHDAEGHVVGLRESINEDWVENARQGIGLESDHYRRAMDLATTFMNSSRMEFEIAGHSKGGGKAMAGAEVTGMPTWTFNSAGLHPETARRYARQTGAELFDVNEHVKTYQVQSEVLTDVQVGVASMDAGTRKQLGRVTDHLVELGSLPDAQRYLREQVQKQFPYSQQVQDDTLDLLAQLGRQPSRDLLATMPVASGQVQPTLPAMTRDASGQLVAREAHPGLGQVASHAGPLLDVVDGATQMAIAGKRIGQGVAWAGQGAEVVLDRAGDGAEFSARIVGQQLEHGMQRTGRLVGSTVNAAGNVAADVRIVTGNVSAAIDHAQCTGARWSNEVNNTLLAGMKWVPFLNAEARIQTNDEATQRYCDLQARQANAAVGTARTDAQAIAGQAATLAREFNGGVQQVASQLRFASLQVGQAVNVQLDATGAAARSVTDKAPVALATVGGGIGLASAVGAKFDPRNPLNLGNYLDSHALIQQAGPAAGEAVQRHGMSETVLPSMDARTSEMELEALRRVQQLRQQEPAVKQEGAMLLNDARHPQHTIYRQAIEGVQAIDAKFGRVPDERSEQLAGHLAAGARQAGLERIDHVMLGREGERMFAIQGRVEDPAHLRASVDTLQGLHAALAESTRSIEAAVLQRDDGNAQMMARLQLQADEQREAGQRALRMG